ncbi:MAG: sulfur carrier protein ThiS [Rhodoblastus sp.]|nr:MAG: sulfur carrier protein ThiS [Rhodoblastus sp.]
MKATTENATTKLTVNGDEVALAAATLAGALDELGFVERVVATALNGVFVPVRLRAETALKDGDRLEILTPMQGG